MIGDRSRLKNFVKKFIGTVRFENDHFGAIMGYGDYIIGKSVISRVYYVEELRNNLFSVGQFCDSDLEVAFRKHSCYVRDTDGVELIKVQTINGKKYILVIVDDYSRFTWVKFLRSKDETPEVVIKFLKQIQVGLNKTVRNIRTDNGTEFVNKDLTDYYERVGIFHQKTVLRTPQQNDVVERQNRTLVEAARTMLIFSKAPMFLWAEAVATACYTQNRSLIHTRHCKTPYELVHDKKPDLTFFRVFGALCYPTNDKLDDFIPPMSRCIHGPPRVCLKDILSCYNSFVPAQFCLVTPSSSTIDQDAPSPSHLPSSSALQSPSLHKGVAADSTLIEDNPFAPVDNHSFINVFAPAIAYANTREPNHNWGSNFPNSPFLSVFKCKLYRSSFEVAFRKHSCYVRDTDGVELIKGSRGSNLYTISIEDMMKSSPICLLSKASKNKSWLWHRRLNHLNFGTINDLARKDLVRGLPRLKFEKDHLCSAYQLGKSKKHTHKPKTENTNLEVLNTLHMDLCGPMRVQTINGKKYILVIVDDYSRFTWVKFLRSKDETPEVVIKFLKQIQVGLNKTVRNIRTDNGTKFVNKDLTDYYERVGIFHQKIVLRTPQ
ncbi:retrovirus-related pol polyprotein from transposon TNT 1-94 [Tanacetum coccineum]